MVTENKKQGDGAFRLENDRELMHEFTYSGALSFCRRRYSRDMRHAEVVVTGIPYDNAVTNRPGTRFGPRAIRAASSQLAELQHFPYGFEPFKHLSVIDYGDCELDIHQPMSIFKDIERHAARILNSNLSNPKFVSIGRITILKKERGKGYGHKLVEFCIGIINKRWPTKKIKISAQAHLKEFYESHGFIKKGGEYLEDGIPHIEMNI